MRRTLPFLVILAASGVLFVLACSGCHADSVTGEDDFELVPEGKEDNYRSSNAMEFSATAEATVVVGADVPEADRAAKANELVSARLLQIGWFLNLWVADKEDEDANKDYGGFHAMARNASVKALKIEPVDATTFKFNFEATIAAQNAFLSLVPGERQTDGAKLVDLKMGKLSNEQLLAGTWQSAYGFHAWDPAKDAPEKVETVKTVIKPIERSSNAYLDYQALYADGKLEVGAQFGYDYNTSRADLANARQLYDDLVAIGFKSPVTGFAELKLDSAALTRASNVNGKTVEVSVKLIHPGMVADPGAAADAVKLREALLDLLATREVVLFNAHAGVSGRLLPANFQATSAGNILPTEYPTLKLYDGFQIFLIEGCQTYARFTDGFRQNPARRGANGELIGMDIVTSTSYTWTSQGAESMEAILFPLVGRSATTLVKPATWDDVLRTMNAPPSETAFMGVNGIDDDPHAHPYAKPENLGKRCTSTAQCGGEGNACIKPSATAAKVCGTVCLDDLGCGEGYRCMKLAQGGTITSRACVKK
jgi:hypothetical protein